MVANLRNWLDSHNIDLHDRHTWILGLIGLAILSVIVVGAWWWLQQQGPISQADHEPFASLQEYDAFVEDHPPFTMQAPQDARFNYKASVTYAKQPLYQIYLTTPAIKPTTKSEDYAAFLRVLQKEAREWFAGQGENLDEAYVQWFPDPASFEPTSTPAQSLPPLGAP